MNGLVNKIQRFSIHDGPGIRTTVFLKGCPLSCSWCQNPETKTDNIEVLFFFSRCIACRKCLELCPEHCFSWEGKIRFRSDKCDQCGLCIESCPSGALTWSATRMSVDEILHEVLKDRMYYDLSKGGITISGGEPLHQLNFCEDLVIKAKESGLNVAVDTSGYVKTEALLRIMPFVDLFLYDIKVINDVLHKKYTGVSNDIILANFRKLCELKKNTIVRIPLIPGITDGQENISQIKKFVRHISKEIKIDYIPFNTLIEQKYRMLGLISM